MEKNELATTGTDTSPMKLISLAMDKPDFDTDKLEKLMELQERHEANLARRAFSNALAAFQAEMPMIKKDRKGKNYQFAAYEDIMKQARGLLIKNQLSISFEQTEDDEKLTVVCILRHSEGHEQRTPFTLPKDGPVQTKDGRNVTNLAQAQGSANSYAKRYCICNALNIICADEDDDGHLAGSDTISEEQAMQIQVLLDKVGFDEEKEIFLKWAKAETVEDILAKDFEKCVRGLEKKLKGGAK